MHPRGIIVALAVYLSMLFGCVVTLLPALPLFFFQKTRPYYKKIIDFHAKSWFAHGSFLLEKIGGVEMTVCGEIAALKALKKPCLIILNHRTELDWMFMWILMTHFGNCGNFKIALKSPLRQIPGGGWATQFFLFLFLDRKWETDKEHITKWIAHSTATDYPMQLLFFPEGTDFTEQKLVKSNAFADKNGLAHTENVLLPRVTGFSYIVSQLRGHGYYLVDMTVLYPKEYLAKIGNSAGAGLIMGIFPSTVHVDIKSYKLDDLPTSEKDLGKKIEALWYEKDQNLKKAIERGYFSKKVEKCKSKLPYLASIFWNLMTLTSLYSCYYYFSARLIFCLGGLLILFISKFLNGIDSIYVNSPIPQKENK